MYIGRLDIGFTAMSRSVVGLVMSVAFASSLCEVLRDRVVWTLGALAAVLGLACYFLIGPQFLYQGALLGVGCGAIVGLGLRFGMSRFGRRIERIERRFINKVAKRLGFARHGGR